MATTFGVVIDHSACWATPFKIDDNPVGKPQPPRWLTSWRFETEYIALLALNLYLSMVGSRKHPNDPNQFELDQSEFRMVFVATVRIARLETAWAN